MVDATSLSCSYTPPGGSEVKVWALVGWEEGDWHHVACIFTEASVQAYADGVLSAAKPYAMALATEARGRIGANMVSMDPLAGAIDHLRIFKKALSDTELATGPP